MPPRGDDRAGALAQARALDPRGAPAGLPGSDSPPAPGRGRAVVGNRRPGARTDPVVRALRHPSRDGDRGGRGEPGVRRADRPRRRPRVRRHRMGARRIVDRCRRDHGRRGSAAREDRARPGPGARVAGVDGLADRTAEPPCLGRRAGTGDRARCPSRRAALPGHDRPRRAQADQRRRRAPGGQSRHSRSRRHLGESPADHGLDRPLRRRRVRSAPAQHRPGGGHQGVRAASRVHGHVGALLGRHSRLGRRGVWIGSLQARGPRPLRGQGRRAQPDGVRAVSRSGRG